MLWFQLDAVYWMCMSHRKAVDGFVAVLRMAICQPLGFWSQLWKGAEVWYSLIEKQLAAVYAALLAMEAITGTAPVTVRTTNPIAGWVRDWMAKPCSGTAQTPMLAKWEAYLQQRSTLSTSPLWAEL